MKMKCIASVALGFFSLALSVLPISADVVLMDTEKSKFSFYGFVKLDAGYQDGGVNSMTVARYATAGQGNLFLNAANSRFGFKFSGAPLDSGLKIGGSLEFDLLDTATPNQMKIRTRQAFFSLQKGNSTFVFGQAWDVFSPLGPTTLNTNGFLWQVGNLGFRHAQVRYSLGLPRLDFSISVSDPASGNGWKSKLPVLQSRLALKLAEKGKIQLGISAAYGKEKTENTAPLYSSNVNAMGICFDWILPLVKSLTLKGEFALGENLANFLGRAGVYNNVAAMKFEAKKSNSLWAELVYVKKEWTAWAGYSFESLTTESQLTANELKDTSCILAGIQYAIGSGVTVGMEYSRFLSECMNSAKSTTNQFMLSGIYSF